MIQDARDKQVGKATRFFEFQSQRKSALLSCSGREEWNDLRMHAGIALRK